MRLQVCSTQYVYEIGVQLHKPCACFKEYQGSEIIMAAAALRDCVVLLTETR